MELGAKGSFQTVTAKARPDYRVQSLHKGHAAAGSMLSVHNHSDTRDRHLCICEQLWCSNQINRLDALFLPDSCSVPLRLACVLRHAKSIYSCRISVLIGSAHGIECLTDSTAHRDGNDLLAPLLHNPFLLQ